MIRQKKFTFFLISLIVGVLLFGKSFIQYPHIEKIYNSQPEQSNIASGAWISDISRLASISLLEKELYILTGTVQFSTPRTTFYFAIDRDVVFSKEDDFKIEWNIDGKKIEQGIDIEDQDMKGYEKATYTFPFLTQPRSHISYTIRSKFPIPIQSIQIITDNDEIYTRKFVFSHDSSRLDSSVYAADGISIVSRADWGANESLRYAGKVSNITTPVKRVQKTQAEMDEIKQENDALDYLETNFPFTNKSVSLIRQENGNKLLWPIQKVKRIDKIIVHHTAENLQSDLDDEALIRAIYKYHAVSKGWGDIGYNYIIGQRGKVYEGRAGGDYVVGAHAAWNNMGSVGISVIGNFEWQNLNRDQESGLLKTLNFFVEKYGIDVYKIVTGHKPCKSSACVFDDVNISALSGHRDVGSTSCPGANLYSRLEDFRTTLGFTHAGITPRDNPILGPIEPKASEDMVEYVLKSSPFTQIAGGNTIVANVSVPKNLKLGPKLRVKLSYPIADTIRLNSGNMKKITSVIGNKRILTQSSKNIEITRVGDLLRWTDGKTVLESKEIQIRSSLSDGLVRIASWDRIPAWDTRRMYNDNIFRGNIVLRIENEKILVVNELPLELYLRGLAEVSNTDNPEKIKTILTAARSYAYYYSNSNNRKFPNKPYDASDDPDVFQKYLGYSYELRSPQVMNMISSTNGQVIKYNNTVIKAWYFSQSDGRTRSYKEYCESNGGKTCEDISYLQGVDDPGGIGLTRKGHGVGISGIGSTHWANNGWDYKKIITYYYTGVTIEKVY